LSGKTEYEVSLALSDYKSDRGNFKASTRRWQATVYWESATKRPGSFSRDPL